MSEWSGLREFERFLFPSRVLDHVRDNLRRDLGLKKGEIGLVKGEGGRTGEISVVNNVGEAWKDVAIEIVAESYIKDDFGVLRIGGGLEVRQVSNEKDKEDEIYWCIFTQSPSQGVVFVVDSQPSRVSLNEAMLAMA